MAFTAAKCSVYCCTGRTLEWFHTNNYRQRVETRQRGGVRGELVMFNENGGRTDTDVQRSDKPVRPPVYAPCYHFHPRLAADGLCST